MRHPTWVYATFASMGVVGVFAIASIVFLLGAYQWHWENPVMTAVARALPVPAARIGGRPILLRDYYRDVSALKTFFASDEAKSQGLTHSLTDEDRGQVVERLLTEAALNEVANLRHVTVNEGELDQMIDTQFNASGTSRGDLAAHIEKTYGWTYDDFKAHIARPALLTRYLEASFASDHPNDTGALNAYLKERLSRSDVVRYVTF